MASSRHEHNRKLWRNLARAKGRQLSNMNKLKNGNYSGMGKNIKRTNYEALSYGNISRGE